jgi:hypothetical protein
MINPDAPRTTPKFKLILESTPYLKCNCSSFFGKFGGKKSIFIFKDKPTLIAI